MDVVALEYAAAHVRSVVVACPQALEGGVLVAESAQECIRKLFDVKGLKRQFRDGCLDFYCIHGAYCLLEFSFPMGLRPCYLITY